MLRKLLSFQSFWVTLVVLALSLVMANTSSAFSSADNLYNVSRNFSFIALIAMGQTLVIICGGVDLSVGSVMALSGITLGLVMQSGHSLFLGVSCALGIALLCGLVNGYLIAYRKLSPFVVTLGMMSIARSIALVISNNKTLYELGPDQESLLQIGGGQHFGIPHPLLFSFAVAAVIQFALKFTRFGQHLYALGGNEDAARLSGVKVARLKLCVYALSSVSAALAAILLIGWLGSVTNALGLGYELTVVAAAVIGGANLKGGEGGAFGAFVGAVLIEVIRNSLLLAKVDPYWQGSFVGTFIILAMLLDRLKARSES